MESQYIKVVTEADFEYEVIAFSNQIPVIVDFWAEWCHPCKTLTPVLEKITDDSKGSFRLAELNVDDNPNLALRYNVRSIPNVKAFRDGQVVSEFLGLQPEARVREFVRNLAPSQIDTPGERFEPGRGIKLAGSFEIIPAILEQISQSSRWIVRDVKINPDAR
jgi:thioredoxin